MAVSRTKDFIAEKERKKQKQLENKREWVSFYRRNWHIFAERVLGIKLKDYQKIFLWMMGNSDSFYSLCSRGSGKTFLTAIAAVCEMCLYPYSEIVISASTESQANKLVTTKILGELINKMSPYLKYLYEHKYIEMTRSDTNNGYVVTNHLNHSTIMSVAPVDSTRGIRSTFLVLDEHRIMKQSAVDKILMPTQRPRQAAYLANQKYNRRRWIEEAKVFYLTSTGYKFESFWRTFKSTFEQHFLSKRLRYNICAVDIHVSIKCGVKSVGDYEKAKASTDDVVFRMEYLNETIGAREDGYFDFQQFVLKQTIDQAFEPPTDDDVRGNRSQPFREKEDTETRMIVADFAFVNTTGATENDNTIIVCMSMRYDNGVFLRSVDYIDVHEASDSLGASDRIRKLYHDYQADYVVFDSRSGGEVIYNHMSEPIECPERGNNWDRRGLTVADVRWHIANAQKIEDYRARTVDGNAIPCLIPFIGSSTTNSQMWISLRKNLRDGLWTFLLPMKQKEEAMYADGTYFQLDTNEIADVLTPHGQMDALIQEAVNLRSELRNGLVSLHEPRNMTKDRIVALAYGNLVFDSIENELRQIYNLSDDVSEIIQSMDIVW